MTTLRATTELGQTRIDALTAVCLLGIGLLVGLACSEWWPTGPTGSRPGAETSIGVASVAAVPTS